MDYVLSFHTREVRVSSLEQAAGARWGLEFSDTFYLLIPGKLKKRSDTG
jgi:hypothetical protein